MAMRIAMFFLLAWIFNMCLSSSAFLHPDLRRILLSEIGYLGKSNKVVVYSPMVTVVANVHKRDYLTSALSLSEIVLVKSAMVFLFSILAVPIFIKKRFLMLGLLLGVTLCIPLWVTSLGWNSMWEGHHSTLYIFVIGALHSFCCWLLVRGEDVEFIKGWHCVVGLLLIVSFLPELLTGRNILNHFSLALSWPSIFPLMLLISWNFLELSCSKKNIRTGLIWFVIQNSGDSAFSLCLKVLGTVIICSFMGQVTSMLFLNLIGDVILTLYMLLCPFILIIGLVRYLGSMLTIMPLR